MRDPRDAPPLDEALARLAAGALDLRLALPGGDPSGQAAARAFNTIAGLLDDQRREVQRAREQLVGMDRMAALGTLAAGLAHEMNQPLTILLALTEMLMLKTDDRIGERMDDVHAIEEAGREIARLVEDIRGFARPASLQLTAIDPRQPCTNAVRLLRKDLAILGIEIEVSAGDDLPAIRASSDRLQQVFVRLLCNARDALREQSSGRRAIRVTVERRGGEVVFAVEDSGPVVPEEVRARLFDPLFTNTTVTTTGGTRAGLGLSVAEGIVRGQGGTLTYEPSPSGPSSSGPRRGAQMRPGPPPSAAPEPRQGMGPTEGVMASRFVVRIPVEAQP